MASDTFDYDDQDQSEVFDEDNQSLDGAGDPSSDMMTLEELPDVLDVTAAVGDSDDDAAAIGEELDDDEIIELETDAALADREDDELAPRMDDWLAEDAPEEGDVEELGVEGSPMLVGLEDDGPVAQEARSIAAETPEDPELEFTDDTDAVERTVGSSASRLESTRELSDEDLQELGYRDENGPR